MNTTFLRLRSGQAFAPEFTLSAAEWGRGEATLFSLHIFASGEHVQGKMKQRTALPQAQRRADHTTAYVLLNERTERTPLSQGHWGQATLPRPICGNVGIRHYTQSPNFCKVPFWRIP